MKSILSRLIFKIKLERADEYSKPAVYAKYLKVNFGKNVRITGEIYFGSEPYLITIGNDVTITQGVTFHNHDGGVGIFRKKYPGINVFKPITVGNNVFIGSNSTLMPGIAIGNNVVIGASSVVTRDIPDNSVVAGVPAKFIRSVDEYEQSVLNHATYISESNLELRRVKILELLGKTTDQNQK
jgi:acetyltransferase-like isoleucine patch superfamily enzyme